MFGRWVEHLWEVLAACLGGLLGTFINILVKVWEVFGKLLGRSGEVFGNVWEVFGWVFGT